MSARRLGARLAAACAAALLAPVLAASPAAADDPAHDPTVKCSAYLRTDGVIVFAGVAYAAPGHPPPVETTVRCSYTAENGRYTSVNTAPAPLVWTYTRGDLKGAIVVCASATASYSDGHVATTPERCDAPDVATPLPEDAFTPALGGCLSHRQTGRWVIATYAVAPVRAVPPTSTTVRCTLTDTNGIQTTAEEPAPAGWSAAAVDALPGPFTSLASRCWEVFVRYADGTAFADGDCERFV